jgi:hypothetical protein
VLNGNEIASFPARFGLESAVERRPAPNDPSADVRVLSITLHRPRTQSTTIDDWHDQAENGDQQARKDCRLVLRDDNDVAVKRYLLQDAWPISIGLHAVGDPANRQVIEDVTFVCDSMQQIQTP